MSLDYRSGSFSDEEMQIVINNIGLLPQEIAVKLNEAGHIRTAREVSRKVRAFTAKRLSDTAANIKPPKPAVRISHRERKRVRDKMLTDKLGDNINRLCSKSSLSPRAISQILRQTYKHYLLLSRSKRL